jgi:MFS family permease
VFGPAVREAMRNRSIRRAELAWLIGIAAQWTYLVAILVYAYDIGGVVAAGLASTLRMLPAAFLAPLVTGIADRLPPGRVLLGVHAGRAVAVGLAALVVVAGLPPQLVFVAIVLEGVIACLHRPTTLALMPALARSPQELVATNALTSSGEALGTLVGPALGGVLLAIGGPGVAFASTAVAFALAALTVTAIDARRPVAAANAAPAGRLRQTLAGFAALRAHPSAGALVALFSVQTFVRGILTVLLVAVSVELLRLGEAGVGYLNSAIGAGGLVGAFLTLALVARRHLALPFSASLAMWGLPIIGIGVVAEPVVAFILLCLLGLANATLDVSGLSLVQRSVPNAVRARAFGAFEGIATLTFGLGSLVAPLLVELLGVRGALVLSGSVLPVLAIVSVGVVRRADDDAVVPHDRLDLLRGVPMFEPLPMTMLELIAGGLVEERHVSGTEVIRQGEAGDCWYLVVGGSAAVVRDDRLVAELDRGDGFGEIALLSQRPRTATVRATEPLHLYRLPRMVFLEAITGTPNAVIAGEQLAASRLAELGL